MRILAIETSCDETACALVEIKQKTKTSIPHIRVLANIVSSQVSVHAPFGGVVPHLAKREHIKNLPLIWEQCKTHPIIKNKKVDMLVVTVGPGLEPALWTGITFAQDIHTNYFQKKIPLVGANHLHGHLYSFLLAGKISKFKFLSSNQKKLFPMVSLIVSGGHTILGYLKNIGLFQKLGETKDDAIGECFDKVARLLGLPYPGGAHIEKIARMCRKDFVPFPSPMLYQKNYHFSYSGLKTAVLYYCREHTNQVDTKHKAQIAAGFQQAALRVLVAKTKRATQEYKARTVSIGGGVAANKALRRMLKYEISENLITPPFSFCMDNAVMIAVAGYIAYVHKIKYPLRANGNLTI